MRRIPIIPTFVVLAAVAVMVALGVWQLQRAQWKGELIAQYRQAQALSASVPWPQDEAQHEGALYRHSQFQCERVLGVSAAAGTSDKGENGWAHFAACALVGGGEAEVALGWSRDPQSPQWQGGEVRGFVGRKPQGIRLVALPPQAGLQQLALPDPGDLPNNHLMYAGQWFFFALTALVIYVLALRKRLAGDGPPG